MHALLNFSHIYLLFSQLTVLHDICIYQVSLLLSVLALAGSADGESERVKEGERGEEVKRVASKEEGLGKEEGQEGGEKDPSLLETALSLMLDHFTYLQGTQGNQKKVCIHVYIFAVISNFQPLQPQVFTTVCSQLLSSVIILRYSPLVIEGSVSLGDKLDAVLCSLFSKYIRVDGNANAFCVIRGVVWKVYRGAFLQDLVYMYYLELFVLIVGII